MSPLGGFKARPVFIVFIQPWDTFSAGELYRIEEGRGKIQVGNAHAYVSERQHG
jgi:hypothetical protein